MREFFEDLIIENHKLLNLDPDDIFNNIFVFLKKHFNIIALKIYLKKNGITSNIFDNSSEDNQLYYTKRLKINSDIEFVFGLIFEDSKDLDIAKDNTEDIDLVLENSANSLYIKLLEEDLENSIIVDRLTGCYNRAYLSHYIKSMFSLASREHKKLAFLKVGVDHFKAVLDEFNYDIGDKIIIALANVLKEGVRDSDLIVRVSNDAFLVILQNISEEDNALIVANKLIDNFKQQKVVVNEASGQVLMKTICIGITIYPKDGTDLDTIIRKSDIAIREAKNRGRSRAFIFSEDETAKIELF